MHSRTTLARHILIRGNWIRLWLTAIVLLFLVAPRIFAQWVTQSITLTNGWNAIYAHVDASHTDLNSLIASDVTNPITEVWRWNPATSIQFLDDPQAPVNTGSQWTSWERSNPSSALQRLVGNSAYLVRVGTNVSTFTWNIKGKPVAAINEWTTTGLNFIGFPAVSNSPPMLEGFLAHAPQLQQEAEIYRYVGGDLNANNPQRVLTFRTIPVRRGQAFWVRAGTTFNHYFGPFQLDMQGRAGVEFADEIHNENFILRNLTGESLTVTVQLLPSEAPPAGEKAIAEVPPLLLRGGLNLTNLTYSFTNLPAVTPRTWTLSPRGQAGSEVEVVVGLNRAAITNAPGTYLAGVLRFTDSLGYTQLDAPVSATVSSRAGLWVGRAIVNQVAQYLKTYALDTEGNPLQDTNGKYIVSETNTSLAGVVRPYPLRLIVHNPSSGNAALLQRVFVGFDPQTNFVASNSESALDDKRFAQARRISSTHLPWSEVNRPWNFDGGLNPGATLSARVELAYDDHASNPFLHTYHPDHDNLDATFKQVLQQGSESYSVRRDITLTVQSPANDFASLTSGATQVSGLYRETITLLGLPRPGATHDTREFEVRGFFTLNRISDVPTLTIAEP